MILQKKVLNSDFFLLWLFSQVQSRYQNCYQRLIHFFPIVCSQLLAKLIEKSLSEKSPIDKVSSGGLRGDSLQTSLAFIGIHDMFKEGDWITVSGEPFVESRLVRWNTGTWKARQPDNGGGKGQNCGAIYKDGTLDDVRCDRKYPYFCEIPSYVYWPVTSTWLFSSSRKKCMATAK